MENREFTSTVELDHEEVICLADFLEGLEGFNSGYTDRTVEVLNSMLQEYVKSYPHVVLDTLNAYTSIIELIHLVTMYKGYSQTSWSKFREVANTI